MCGDSTLHCPWWQWLGDFEGQRLSYADMDGAGRGPGNLPMPQVGKRGPSQADAGGTEHAAGRTLVRCQDCLAGVCMAGPLGVC